MALNKQNLKVPTSEQARINGRKGGLASAKAKKERKTFAELIAIGLETLVKDPRTQGKNEITAKELIVARMILQAQQGNLKAIEMIRDQIGEKPSDKLQVEGDFGLSAFGFKTLEEYEK